MLKKPIFAGTKNFNEMETIEKTKVKKSASKKNNKEEISARDRIKPRGLWGWMEGKIHYDKDADIFNLAPL
jgi:hypothetical protein